MSQACIVQKPLKSRLCHVVLVPSQRVIVGEWRVTSINILYADLEIICRLSVMLLFQFFYHVRKLPLYILSGSILEVLASIHMICSGWNNKLITRQ